MKHGGTVTRAARLLRVLRDEFGATTPNDISDGAVGDSIVDMIQESLAAIGGDLIDGKDPALRYTGTGRILVVPEYDEGHLTGFNISVEV